MMGRGVDNNDFLIPQRPEKNKQNQDTIPDV
jgi:hypothetical protein